MPAHTYDYAFVRVVPRVEQGEFINVGVVFFCRTERFLDVRLAVDQERLLALAPDLELDLVTAHLEAIPQICDGAGPIGQLPQAERFHWLVAPRSTIIQTSPVHSGLCDDPDAALERITETMARAS